MEQVRDLNWMYADISCAAYRAEEFDSIREDGSHNDKSFLTILVTSVMLLSFLSPCPKSRQIIKKNIYIKFKRKTPNIYVWATDFYLNWLRKNGSFT